MIDVRKLEADSGLQSRMMRRGKDVISDAEHEMVNADDHVCSKCGARSQRRAWKGGVCKVCRKGDAPTAPEKTGGGTRVVNRTPKKAATAVAKKLSGGSVDLVGLLSAERSRLAARIEAIDKAVEALSE